jgi:hypothetical protein
MKASGKIADAVPIGCIVLWSGTIDTIPVGWLLCNGSSGTVDLRDKFVVGAKQDVVGVPKTNITGSLTQSGGSVTHDHIVSGTSASEAEMFKNAQSGTGVTAAPNGHTHIVNITSAVGGTLPIYWALAFIQKV